MHPLVSIVVPIYKVERYLRQCVDSLLAQSLQNIELILVDDGSPDSCPAIVDEYAAKDSRVVAIHQPNGGYGKAVNTGIARASAPYIGIIESDDWVEPTMYEKLYHRAVETGVDVVKCLFWKYNSLLPSQEQDWLWQSKAQNLFAAPDGAFCPRDWEPLFHYHASLWSNLYRADFLREIRFIETAGAAYQDFPFIMEVYARAKSLAVVKEPLVHYRMEPNQASSTTGKGKGLLRMLDMTIAARAVLQKYNLLDSVRESFYYHAYLANIGFLENICSQYQQEYFERLGDILSPIANDSSFSWRYFDKRQKRKACIIMQGKNVRHLKRSWRLNIKHGKIHLVVAGREFNFHLYKH